MSISYKFTCEGCDIVIEQQNDWKPTRWNWTGIRLNFWEGYSFLLCDSCSHEMRRFKFFKATLVKIGILK